MHRAIQVTVLVLGGTLALVGCGDECSSYSHYSCEEIERADYNVFFYYPSEQELYLGHASGLSECQTMAHNYAINKEIVQADWGYVCCMIAHGSDCYEKHK
jgi:predicted CoA-binding protein